MITNKRALGVGRTADVFEWEHSKVVKLFHKNWSANSVTMEYKHSKFAADLGVSAPDVFDMVEINGRQGIIFEKIQGRSMLDVLKGRPHRTKSIGKELAELHYNLNQKKVSDLPSQKDHYLSVLDRKHDLTSDQAKITRAQIEKLKQTNNLLHNDFHPDNVIITDEGSRVIDWITISQGNPISDLVRSKLLLTIGSPPETNILMRGLIGILRNTLNKSYTNHYMKLSDLEAKDLEEFLLPTLLIRLIDDGIAEERTKLIIMIEKEFENY